ncbi:MAG: aldose 1-epimerase family protein [Thermoproteales archaeon]|nr:aldose 1-epimerase family protein [Thermoproteales archaeon]
MVYLYGKNYTKEELLKKVGSLQQIFYNRMFEFIDGKEKGVRGIDIKNPSGLSFIVLLDRGMDIPFAEYKGISLGWNSPIGYVSPSFFESEGDEWLRGYFGGLLTTCGLTYLGAPNIDLGEILGLHGRISYTPAERVSINEKWHKNELTLEIVGKIREAKVFGPNILLERKISTSIYSKKILIEDKVRNEGWTRQPLMILYHINIGFPILDEGSYLVSTSIKVAARDDEAKEKIEEFNIFHKPVKGYREKVYFHELVGDREKYAYAAIINENLFDGIGVYIKFKKDTLKRLIEWKMLGEGTYVVGIEPSNCFVMGRSWERKKGLLEYIDPQEEKSFSVEIGVLDGKNEIQKFKEKVQKVKKGAEPELYEKLDLFLKNIA